MIGPARHPAFDAAARHAHAMLRRLTPKWLRPPAPRAQGCAQTLTGASLSTRLGAWRAGAQNIHSAKEARSSALAYCQLFSDARAMAFPPPRGLRAPSSEGEAGQALLACCRELSTLSKAWPYLQTEPLRENSALPECCEDEPSTEPRRERFAPRSAAAMILHIVSALQPWETGLGAHPIAQAALGELRGALGACAVDFLEALRAEADSAPLSLGWSHKEFVAFARAELFRRTENRALEIACRAIKRAPNETRSSPRL